MLEGATTNALVVEARTFEHRIFLNRTTHFESRPLPAPAQFAPGFGIAVADFNGDSHEDLFLAQNCFDLDLDSGRADAGTGLCLLGDGRGGFRALSPAESGIALHGQQRGAAVADFDQDGRPDLCVTQHNHVTALLPNTAGAPGTRIRLHGPPGNPHAIGASLRRILGGKPAGPVREIRSGSGYLSADSPTLTFPRLDRAYELEVVWPDLRRTRHAIPANALEVTLPP